MAKAKTGLTRSEKAKRDARISQDWAVRAVTLEREKVEMIAKHGDEKRQLHQTIRDMRAEYQEHLLAGMLLMREMIRTKLKENDTVASIALQHTNIGIKALVPYVELGLMKLTPEGLELYCESVLRRLAAEKAKEST